MIKTLQTSAITASILLGSAAISQAATTIATVESALAGGTGTYMDLQSSVTGFTNDGITGVWSNWSNSWGFTTQTASTGDGGTSNGAGDTSDSAFTVFGRSADDKGQTTNEIQVDYSGLTINATYDIYAVMFVNADPGESATHDLAWGTTSNALTTVTGTPDFAGYTIINGLENDKHLEGFLLGQVSTDGAGAVTIYYDQALGGTTTRTQFDGVLFNTVPEPSSAALLGLGGIALILRRRK